MFFLGVLEIPDIFWGERQMLGPSLHMRKKIEYPSGVGLWSPTFITSAVSVIMPISKSFFEYKQGYS